MFSWLKTIVAPAPERPDAPQNEIFAVGDIHGRYDLLAKMIESLLEYANGTRPELIFLGDYIDRGPQSREVVDLLLREEITQHFEPVFLKGNHEATLLEFLDDPGVGPSWMQYGGGETLMSYGVRPPSLRSDQDGWAEASRALRNELPASHHTFYKSLKLSVERGCYMFVHAGVDPSKPLDAQGEGDLLWIREAFIQDDRALSRIIVHGHTPETEPYEDHRRIGLDLGGYQTGRLGAARINGGKVSLITISSGN